MGAALLVFAAGSLLWGALPWWIRGEGAHLLAERSGLRVAVRGAEVFHDGIALHGIRLDGREEGVHVRAGSVRLRCSPWSWVWTGSQTCRALRAEDLHVEVDVGAAAFESWWAKRARSSARARDGGPGERVVLAERVALLVRDGYGPLIAMQGARAVLRDGRAGLGAEALTVGAADGERWEMAGLHASTALEAGNWRLAGLSSRSGRVVSGVLPGAPTLRDRLSALVARVGRSSGHAGLRAGSAEPRGVDWATGWSKVADRANVWMGDLTVATRGPLGEQDSVRELRGAIVRGPGDIVRTWGTGRGVPGGSVQWDLEVRPGDLRGEGTVRMEDLPLGLLGPLLPDVAMRSAREARVDGELALRGDGLERLDLAGNVRVRGLVFESPRIAPTPVRGVAFAVSGRGAWVPARGRLEFDGVRLALGTAADPPGAAVSVTAAGALEWQPDHYLVDVVTTLPNTPCGAAVAAIPRDLLADVANFRMAGTLAGRLRVFVDSRDFVATRVDVDVTDQCVFEEVPSFADMRRFGAPFVHRALEPDGTEFAFETGPGSAAWTPIAEMSPFLLHAVIAHEDAGFVAHQGFAASEIQVALVRNLTAGRYVQGASTITMQLVKNVFLHREKTLARKLQEVLLTWWTERVFSKERILELYLNVIEYGPSVYGIRHAAEHYFGRAPGELSVAESAFLATILPSPKLFHGAYVDGSPSLRLRERLRVFLRRLADRGRIDAAALEAGLADVENMTFHREGAERPPPRALVGTARTLPFAMAAEDTTAWPDEADEAPDPSAFGTVDDASGAEDDAWSSDAE